MKLFRQFVICILSIVMLTACSKSAKSVSLTDAFGYLSAEKYKEAAEAFTSIIAENPDSMEAYSGRGDAYAYSGEYILAAADYSKAAQLSENNVLYILKSAVIYNLIDEKDEAEKNLFKAIEVSKGTISSEMSSEVTKLITKLKAEESSKAVLDFIKTAAKESETAAVPTPTPAAAETPKADSTPTPAATQEAKPTPTPAVTATPKPTPTPTPAATATPKPTPTPTPAATVTPKPTPTPTSSSSTKPSNFKGTLADIKNLNELLDCIAVLSAPFYSEMKGQHKEFNPDPPFEYYVDYYTVNKFKSVDDYRNHYKKFMTDEMAKKMIQLGYRFAVRNGKLYSLEIAIGYGGMDKKGVKLKQVDKNGDYIIRIPYISDGSLEVDFYTEYKLRYVNGKFIIADCLTNKLSKSAGYAIVNTNHLNIRKKASTSSDKLGRLNTGAVVDVYEVKKDSKYTWYKIGNPWGDPSYPYGWIANDGSWIKYVKYK